VTFGLPGISRYESAFASIAAALIVHGALYSRMGELFSSPPCQFLGKISFPLYLIHVPLLYTAFAALYVAIAPLSSTEIFAIFVLFLVASLCISWLAEKAVDAPTLEAIALIRTKFPIPQSPTHA
jgi:peptidoglycan/LPS O-acetylase OafA/YrhL